MSKSLVMVELQNGYGDGYGVVSMDGDRVRTEPGSKATTYPGGAKIEDWEREILAAESVLLVDRGTKVPPGAIKRVIGDVNGPEASRIKANRYTGNWSDRAFVAKATDEELAYAMSADDEPTCYARMCDLRKKHA